MARLALLLLSAWSISAYASPVEEVITLLTDLKTQVEDEGKEEATAYETFACFCKDTTKEKSESIKTGQDTINELSANIESNTADQTEKQADLTKRKAKQNELAGELTETQARCMTEEAEVEAKVADLKKAISSLSGAIDAMTGAKGASFLALKTDVRAAVSESLELAEALSLSFTPKQQAVVAFLQQGKADPGDYKFHSGGIIDTLEKLKTDFEKEKDDAKDAGDKAKEAGKELKSATTKEMGENNDAMDTLKADISDLKSKIAEDREALVDAQSQMQDDQEFLKEVTTKCESRANTWDQRSKMRAGELEALSAALEILEGKVKDLDSVNKRDALLAKRTQNKKADSMMKAVSNENEKAASIIKAVKRSVSFLQEGSAKSQLKVATLLTRALSSRERKAHEVLRTAAERLNSPVLSAIAEKIAADPFLKVKALITGLIHKLLDELKNEAEQKGFCDQEAAKATGNRDYRFADAEKLTVELGELENKKDELKETISTLEDEAQSTRDELKEAEEARAEDKEANLESIKKAKEGKNAVKEAISILKTFYDAAANKHVFLQIPDAGFEGGYKGNQDKSEDIIGLLQTIQNDFENTLRTTEALEKKAAADHVEFDRNSKATIAAKETGIELNTQDLEATRSSIVQKTGDLEDTQKMVDSALQAIADLKPLCFSGMSYEDKVAKREEEIAALKKATCYLDPEKKEDDCKGEE